MRNLSIHLKFNKRRDPPLSFILGETVNSRKLVCGYREEHNPKEHKSMYLRGSPTVPIHSHYPFHYFEENKATQETREERKRHRKIEKENI